MPLPDRNPERPPTPAQQAAATPDAQPLTPDAAPSAKEAAPSATEAAPSPTAPEPVPADNETTVAAIPEPERNPEKPASQAGAPVEEAAAPTPVNVPLPDVNPNRGLPMSPPAPQPALNYSAILKPLLSYDLSAADEANLKIVAHGKGNVDATTAKISDTAARAFALWYRYKHNKSTTLSAEAVERFRLTHPHWPGQDDLREKAETSLFLTDASPEQVKLFFGASDPQTGAGKAAVATVYLKEGNETGAKELVVSAWRDHMLNEDVEKKILDKFGSMLTEEHHRARIDRFLYPDKESLAADALRIAKLLPADEQKKVAARVAVLKRGGNAGKLLDALPDDAIKADVGLRFNNIQWLRRTKDKDQRLIAFKLLLDAPQEPNVLLDLNEWWVERRINVRAALSDGHPRTAYEIAAKHGLASGDSFIEAEYLAGWIALRFLNEPHTALRHFLALRKAATSSKNIALGEYWLGRTALTLGDRGSALIHFHGAAKYPQYFYGQLGRQALDPRPARLEVTSTPVPTQADIDRFMAHEGVRAIGIARAANMDWVTPQFFFAMARTLDSAAEVVLLAELAKAMDKWQIGLRLAKIAFNRDLPLGDYALPVGVMPAFKSLLEERVDPALCHALSRQESEFNASAKSPVGASGLMQLMPATAKGVARRYKVTYSQAQLTNPTYNQQLGEAFLNDLISSYSGSYFLALAAYNAGPGRVKEWMEKHGDPRDPDVDPVDWIERIPFTETREYVFKIMETLQLYRSRLSGPDQALHLVQDLNRGRKVPSSETASVAVMPATKAP
ncbi:MAG: transglycosylase SLT domain-containing protein [Methyloceanibacter sp.]|uniref:lytic transglycosylase domain-containing protein n=1 Tax=Methyloceanibacter sp. TaxID=1965321 RepID=UPI003D6CAE77